LAKNFDELPTALRLFNAGIEVVPIFRPAGQIQSASDDDACANAGRASGARRSPASFSAS